MTKKVAFKEFAIYSSLNVLGMIGISVYILADTFFVAKGMGMVGLAALNLALPIYGFIRGIGVMLGMGGATKYSVLRAQDKSEEANSVFTHTLIATLFMSLIYVFLGFFLSNHITNLLGADSEVFEMTQIYLKTLLLGAPIFMLSDMLILFVRNDRNPRLSMFAMLGGSLSNILLDYIFIFLFKMGIFGAVLATVVSTLLGISILFLHFLRKKNNFRIIKTRFSFSLTIKITALGLPSLITELSSSVVLLVFNLIIVSLAGNVGVAAYGVVANLSFVVGAIFIGISQGMQPLTSRAHGLGDKNTIRRLLHFSLITVTIISIIIYILIFFLAGPIAHLFNSENNPELQQIAIIGLELYFTAILFMGFNTITSTFFTSIERPIPAQIISVLKGLVIIIPMAILMSSLLGITGVWLSFPASEGIVAIVSLILILISRKAWGKHNSDNLLPITPVLIDPSRKS